MRWLSGQTRIRRYQYGWFVCVAPALALRFTVLAESRDRFAFAMTFIVGTWISTMILNVIEGQRLMRGATMASTNGG